MMTEEEHKKIVNDSIFVTFAVSCLVFVVLSLCAALVVERNFDELQYDIENNNRIVYGTTVYRCQELKLEE